MMDEPRHLLTGAGDAMRADASLDFIDALLDAVWMVDEIELCIISANRAAGRLLGVDPRSLTGRDVTELAFTPEDAAFWNDVSRGLAHEIESRSWITRPDGSAVPVMRRVSRARLPSGRPVFIVAVHDRSDEARAEGELERRVAELSATLESTADGILVTDLDGNIRAFNRRFAGLWDLPAELLEQRDDGNVLTRLQREVIDSAGYMRRLAAIEAEPSLESRDTLTLKSGRTLERVTLPQWNQGVAIGRVYSFRDVSDRVEDSRRIDTLSHTDALTGLFNRRMLVDRIEFAISMARRDESCFALLFINLDRFKHVNDSLGHNLGDRVLADVAERLKSCLRAVDTVARVGSDEFVVLVHQAASDGAEVAAWRVMDIMLQPYEQGGMRFTLTCSIGISLYGRDGGLDGANAEELIRAADVAMQDVKEAGRASYRYYRRRDDDETQGGRTRLTLDHAMRQAFDNGGFRLHYQPQVDMNTGEVRGAEALIRWTDPVLGEVSPGEFIPVAEESGFIIPIGDWVLREAVRQAADWHARGLRLVVSVNVSAVQFRQPHFLENVAEVIRASGLAPHWLELELTESILIQNAQDALMRLQALAQLGVRLAIDDFGTGYSSLGYLKRFPIGRLKIDRSFVRGLPLDASDVGIVNAIVNLGRALKMEVIAEGVETEAQRAFLGTVGCDEYQGFLYAPALGATAFEARLEAALVPAATETTVHDGETKLAVAVAQPPDAVAAEN